MPGLGYGHISSPCKMVKFSKHYLILRPGIAMTRAWLSWENMFAFIFYMALLFWKLSIIPFTLIWTLSIKFPHVLCHASVLFWACRNPVLHVFIHRPQIWQKQYWWWNSNTVFLKCLLILLCYIIISNQTVTSSKCGFN